MNIHEMVKEMHLGGLMDSSVASVIGVTTTAIYRIRSNQKASASYKNGKAITELYEKFKAGKVKMIPASIQIKD
jgi:hypothetical protein